MNYFGTFSFLTVSTASALILRPSQVTTENISKERVPEFSPSFSRDDIVVPKIPRCESEFSLGLGRSKSIDRELSQFGELCYSGQIFLLALRITLGVVVGVYGIDRILKKG